MYYQSNDDCDAVAEDCRTEGLHTEPHSGCGLEITNENISKGAGPSFLCEYLGVPPAEVIAFGDGENDVSVMRVPGTGVAVGNAVPECRRACDVPLENTNNQGAVGSYVLNQMFGLG